MKALLVVVSIALVICAAGMIYRHEEVKGSNRLLDIIRQLPPGSSIADVTSVLGREPQIVPAKDAPGWIYEVAPKFEDGQYAYFFMGFPPRNIVIYFDRNGRLVFCTWSPT
jgi:outer membrane protein assembly factor BamE (lipoprotein component of BamABCDE complex)